MVVPCEPVQVLVEVERLDSAALAVGLPRPVADEVPPHVGARQVDGATGAGREVPRVGAQDAQRLGRRALGRGRRTVGLNAAGRARTPESEHARRSDAEHEQQQPGHRIERLSSGQPGADYGSAVRVAIAHEWLVRYAGSERVVVEMLKAFPGAPLVTTIVEPSAVPPSLAEAQPSFLQHVPGLALTTSGSCR